MVGGWFANAANPVLEGAFKWSVAHGIPSLTGISGIRSNQGFRDLGVLVGGNQSSAQSINNHGHAVGWSRTTTSGSNRAVLWLNTGQMRNLNETSLFSPLTGWTLTQAEEIGASGHIVGWGLHNGVTRAFLLTPNVLGY